MSKGKLDFVFGCRSPTSKYARDGAFVVCKLRGTNDIIAAEFANGMDFIGHPTYDEGMIVYHKYIAIGWRPMDIVDLDNTAIDKAQIDEATTLTTP
jgi:hypothetical protein